MTKYFNRYLTCPLFRLKEMRSFSEVAILLDLHEEEFREGTCILERGMASKEVLIVLEGSVEELAGEAILRVLGKSECFALSLALTKNRSLTSWRARKRCVIGYAPIIALQKQPEIMENLLRLMARETEEASLRMALLSQKSTREKLSWFLQAQKELHHSSSFIIPLKRKELARFMGVTNTSLYLEVKRLKEEGKLKTKGTTWSLLS